jgi:hypothetical protein
VDIVIPESSCAMRGRLTDQNDLPPFPFIPLHTSSVFSHIDLSSKTYLLFFILSNDQTEYLK